MSRTGSIISSQRITSCSMAMEEIGQSSEDRIVTPFDLSNRYMRAESMYVWVEEGSSTMQSAR